MATIPCFNGLTTQLTPTLTQPLLIFLRNRELIRHKQVQAFLLPSLFLLLLFFVHHQWLFLQRDRGEDMVGLFLVKEVLPLLVVQRREAQKVIVVVLTPF